MKKQFIQSIQEWLPIEGILEKGIIELKDHSYIKIIKITPINYNLKSDLEKQAILNSYQLFLKTCNFDIQIIIQSDKKDLSKHIIFMQEQLKKSKNKNLILLSENYINFIQKMNQENKSSSKNFYIVIKKSMESKKENLYKELILQELNDQYFKIKECLSRCGNIAIQIENKKELIKILKSFFGYQGIENEVS